MRAARLQLVSAATLSTYNQEAFETLTETRLACASFAFKYDGHSPNNLLNLNIADDSLSARQVARWRLRDATIIAARMFVAVCSPLVGPLEPRLQRLESILSKSLGSRHNRQRQHVLRSHTAERAR